MPGFPSGNIKTTLSGYVADWTVIVRMKKLGFGHGPKEKIVIVNYESSQSCVVNTG